MNFNVVVVVSVMIGFKACEHPHTVVLSYSGLDLLYQND